MPVVNATVAAIFEQIADLLDIQGANPFRIRAYRNAARTIGGLGADVKTLLEQGTDLRDLPGIGDDLAAKIREIVETGKSAWGRHAAAGWKKRTSSIPARSRTSAGS